MTASDVTVGGMICWLSLALAVPWLADTHMPTCLGNNLRKRKA